MNERSCALISTLLVLATWLTMPLPLHAQGGQNPGPYPIRMGRPASWPSSPSGSCASSPYD